MENKKQKQNDGHRKTTLIRDCHHENLTPLLRLGIYRAIRSAGAFILTAKSSRVFLYSNLNAFYLLKVEFARCHETLVELSDNKCLNSKKNRLHIVLHKKLQQHMHCCNPLRAGFFRCYQIAPDDKFEIQMRLASIYTYRFFVFRYSQGGIGEGNDHIFVLLFLASSSSLAHAILLS